MFRRVTSLEMDPIRCDPNNHAPAVAPGDIWDDAHGFEPAAGEVVAMLPRKKSRAAAPDVAAGNDDQGCRITGTAEPRPRPADAEPAQLEVREIDGTVMRLAPAAPTAPKVPRQAVFQEAPAGNSLTPLPRDVSHEWGRVSHLSMRWILGTGLGVATVVIVALALLPLINQSNAARPHQGEVSLVMDPQEPTAGLQPVSDLLGRRAEAVRLFTRVMRATTAGDLQPCLRDAAAVEPLIRTHHRPSAVPADWSPPADTTWQVCDNDGHPFALLQGSLPDFSRFTAYWVVADHHLRLDWKATTGYGTATFDELARQQGSPAEIRGKITPGDYFTAAYPETDFQCYQLVAPDDSQAVWCYVRHNDPLATTLTKLCQGDDPLNQTPTQQKITVRLAHGPAGSLPNQWLIAQVLHQEWLAP